MISNYRFDSATGSSLSDILIETSRFSRVLKDTTSSEKISISDFQILLLLTEKGPMSVAQLSKLLYKSGSNMVPPVKKLESKGYVASSYSVDGRSKRIEITDKGIEYTLYLMAKARQRHNLLYKYSL